MNTGRTIYRLFGALLLTFGLMAATTEMRAQDVRLERAVIANGGGSATNGTNGIGFTVGQPVVGTVSNDVHTICFGFWCQALVVSSVADGVGAITRMGVSPNPIVNGAEIRVELAKRGQLDVFLYNTLGQQVATLFSGDRESGEMRLDLDADELTSGAYFVVARMPGAILQLPVTVAK